MERGAARLCQGLPLSGAGRLESAREKMERGWMRCARGWMRGEGSQSLWSHRSPVCKEWCVCVCEQPQLAQGKHSSFPEGHRANKVCKRQILEFLCEKKLCYKKDDFKVL